MQSSFDPRAGEWRIAWPGRVARHDLVYGSPPADPTQGIPLGNGDVGALAWCEGSRIVFALNKCDLWDDAPIGRFHNWKAEEEEASTTLRHAGRLVIDFHLPVFDLVYLSDFAGRLSLAEARLSLTASGPFGRVSCEAFLGWDDGVLHVSLDSDLAENVPLDVRVERYGSRTFSHWYALVNRDPAIGLAGTEAHAGDVWVGVTQRLTSGTFGLGCRVVSAPGLTVRGSRSHSRSALVTAFGDRRKEVELVVAVVPPADETPLARLREAMSRGAGRRRDVALDAHRDAWKRFWLRSLVEYGDDYLDNLWHLTMYYAAASQRGPYPGRFINGLWGWSGDTQNWNFYFHWNQQQTYWPLNAAGHHDLIESYLRYRFDSLPHAREDARDLFGADGAFVSDVAERRGYNSAGEHGNHTPVAQIAMDFWRQYLYTVDDVFLREKALPYLLDAARFCESLVERADDGAYHAREGTGYEGWIKLRDGITELVYVRVVLATALRALEIAGSAEPRSARWREILDGLTPLPVVEAPAACVAAQGDGQLLDRGLFKGEPAPSRGIFAAGWGIAEGKHLFSKVPVEAGSLPPFGDAFELLQIVEQNATPYSRVRDDMTVFDGIFPSVEYSAVYPSGLIGLADRESELYRVAVTTAKLQAPDCMGWDPIPLVLARLGLGAELERVLARWAERWQYYCNGFGHYGPRDVFKADAALRFRTTLVKDAAAPDAPKFPFPAWPFRHMGMESMSVLSAAMNEALLQSHDGTIRVAPACRAKQAARFTLHAAGGFVVSAEIRDGRPLWVHVESRVGGALRVASPWPACHVTRNGRPDGEVSAAVAELLVEKGERVLLTPDRATVDGWEVAAAEPRENASHKVDGTGRAMLGLPRMF
jgi:alpha-L-fucosidase 2